ncbi:MULTISPECIES: Fic family protein [Actinomyces]|uniref:Fic family protein n=1 Tax=Actinomyces respiraculi TaxID=2744574 RepID=A0A7T0PWW0_9ACTO|nr:MULTISPECIES: Fic family protein [Actinomyces]QPL06159.1 Fic family protein [Actinomyces respiraculi]
MEELSLRTLLLLGEATSQCDHLANSVMPPAFAQELHLILLDKGALGTTAIEGNTMTEEEVRGVIEGSRTLPPSRSYQQQEIEALVALFNQIAEECLGQDEPPLITPKRLKLFHARLLDGQPEKDGVIPGELRTHSVTVGNYRGAPPEDCEYLVDRLCHWLNAMTQQSRTIGGPLGQALAIVAALLAHLYLAWIHPFGDGNGRMARLLEFDMMIRAGFPVAAAHLLSDHYNRTRDRYYAVLDQVSRGRYRVDSFVAYAVEGLVDGQRDQIHRITVMQEHVMWQSFVHQQFQGEHTPARARQKDLALALPVGEWTRTDDVLILTSDIAKQYRGRTSKTVTRDLNELVKRGLVVRERGKGVRPRAELMTAFRLGRVEM